MRRLSISRISSPATFFSFAASFHFLICVDQFAERRAADLVECAVAEADGGRGVAQPAAAALAAIDLADELFEQCAQARRELRGFFECGIEAFVLESEEGCRFGTSGSVGSDSLADFDLRCRVDRDPFFFGAEEDRAALARREVVVRHVDRHAGVRGEGRQHQLRNGQAHIGPDQQRAFFEREVRVAQQCGRVRADLRAETFARRAPAERAVEREIVRIERVEAAAAFFAGQVLAVNADGPARLGDVVVWDGRRGPRLCPGRVRFRCCRRCASGHRAGRDAVDDHFDRVLAAAVDRRRLLERMRFAVDAHADVAAAAESNPRVLRTARRRPLRPGP